VSPTRSLEDGRKTRLPNVFQNEVFFVIPDDGQSTKKNYEYHISRVSDSKLMGGKFGWRIEEMKRICRNSYN
jgi:hypothetical protein